MVFHWNLDPVLFNLLGVFPIQYYSLFFALGLLLGFQIVKNKWKAENLEIELLDRLALYVFIATLLGARMGHCLFYEPAYYLQNPLEIIIPFKNVNGHWTYEGFRGLASHGGILAVFVTIILFAKNNQLSVFSILDKVAIGGAVTGVFIRIGNFMNSEIIGLPTGGQWGVIFEKVDMVPRHPAQLYEAMAYSLIYIVLNRLYNVHNRKRGFIFGLFFALLFLSRFIIEFFKENQVIFESDMTLNMGQLLSIPFFLIGIVVMIMSVRR